MEVQKYISTIKTLIFAQKEIENSIDDYLKKLHNGESSFNMQNSTIFFVDECIETENHLLDKNNRIIGNISKCGTCYTRVRTIAEDWYEIDYFYKTYTKGQFICICSDE